MKKILTLLFIAFSFIGHSQEIIEREDMEDAIHLISSYVPLRSSQPYCMVNFGVYIPKDTVTINTYIISFFYDTPKEILLDTTAEVDIRFSDGTLFTFNNANNAKKSIMKDSMIGFRSVISYNCLQKIIHVPIAEIKFNTPLYTHQILMEDKMRLFLPTLAQFIVDKSDAEFDPILEEARSLDVSAITFDPTANKQLDKKYFGKYTGEWNMDETLANFELYIQSDTSYILWHFLKGVEKEDLKNTVRQTLNIRGVTENNILIMDVCYDENDPGHTNGRRTYYLKLSEDGKVIYGSTKAFVSWVGYLYGKKVKRFSK